MAAGLAEVAGQVDQGHTGIPGDGLLDHLTGAVTAAIVDEHDFKLVFERGQFGIYRADEGVYALFLVVNGNDQRESKIGTGHGNFLIERIILQNRYLGHSASLSHGQSHGLDVERCRGGERQEVGTLGIGGQGVAW